MSFQIFVELRVIWTNSLWIIVEFDIFSVLTKFGLIWMTEKVLKIFFDVFLGGAKRLFN